MAITDTNITLVGNVPQDILLGDSSSFIVQNISNCTVRFKVKGSSIKYGGVLSPYKSLSFACDITIWANNATIVYVIRD